MQIEIVAPSLETLNYEEVENKIEAIRKQERLEVFSDQALTLSEDLSKTILADKNLRVYPELIALGYWLRRANITRIKDEFIDRKVGDLILARGLALTFAPANVDTIFVYTWILSLLAGNSNVIRLSQRENVQVKILLEIIREVMKKDDYKELAERLAIIRYPHSEEITAYLSKSCHLRIIWGGDKSVQAIRAIPLAPLATEMVFPDRFALAVFDAKTILEESDKDLHQLAMNFYNDTLFFHQLACSSPRLVYWQGEEKNITKAKERFWPVFEEVSIEKEYVLPPAVNMTRLTTGFVQATKEEVVQVSGVDFQIPLRIQINDFKPEMREEHLGAGLFYEYHSPDLEDLHKLLADKDQTICYHGIDKKVWHELLPTLANRGIDRIVPVGQALDFSHVWDGYRMLDYMTRIVDVQ